MSLELPGIQHSYLVYLCIRQYTSLELQLVDLCMWMEVHSVYIMPIIILLRQKFCCHEKRLQKNNLPWPVIDLNQLLLVSMFPKLNSCRWQGYAHLLFMMLTLWPWMSFFWIIRDTVFIFCYLGKHFHYYLLSLLLTQISTMRHWTLTPDDVTFWHLVLNLRQPIYHAGDTCALWDTLGHLKASIDNKYYHSSQKQKKYYQCIWQLIPDNVFF